jgi:methionyl-tRNA formyltransferase
MKITILCSSNEHPVNAYLAQWVESHQHAHDIDVVRNKTDLIGGDILFLISCTEIISNADRCAFKNVLVIHASDLPHGRGWSPHVWQIIEGKEEIVLSMLEAEDKVDTGDIWEKLSVRIPKHALFDEINHLIFEAELALMDHAIASFLANEPVPQDPTITATYYPKRTPNHSRVDVKKSIESQFNLIRVCDPDLYPAFFDLHGHRYRLRLEKLDE